MAKNLEKPEKQDKIKFSVVDNEVSAIEVSPSKKHDEDVEDADDADDDDVEDVADNDNDAETEDTEEDIAVELDESEDEQPEDEPEQPKAKQLTKEQRKIRALKNEIKKRDLEKAELQKKLEDKAAADSVKDLAKQIMDEEGLDEKEATKRASKEVKQSVLEKQVEVLLFEKKHRKVLSQYPEADNDLDKIMRASETGVMTVEQICKGLYGSEMTEKEKRAINALKEDAVAGDNSVAKSIRSAAAPVRTKLNAEQMKIKSYLEGRFHKKLTDEDVIKLSE